MKEIPQQIKNSDFFVSVMASEGHPVTKQGSKYFARCPMHQENTPSFCIFPDGHAKCFGGCGWYGDAVDLVQDLHGLTFKEALRHLGISQKSVTADMRRQIAEAGRNRKKKQVFKQRRRDLLYTLAVEVRKARKILANIKTEQQMESVASLFHGLPFWQHCHDVLINGEHQDVQSVMDALSEFKLINRRPLFKPDFDYRRWLRDFTNGRTVDAT